MEWVEGSYLDLCSTGALHLTYTRPTFTCVQGQQYNSIARGNSATTLPITFPTSDEDIVILRQSVSSEPLLTLESRFPNPRPLVFPPNPALLSTHTRTIQCQECLNELVLAVSYHWIHGYQIPDHLSSLQTLHCSLHTHRTKNVI